MNTLTFDEYQKKSTETAIYPNKGEIAGLMYCGLGLASEAGEVAGKIKKYYRDGMPEDEVKKAQWYKDIGAELMDCGWYLSQIAEELGLSLGDEAKNNIDKLQSRMARGVLSGSGDTR